MPSLLLRFKIELESDFLIDVQPYGPIFNRWLPEGKDDAIVLDTGDASSVIKVWFERRGFVDTYGFIRFDYDRQEVDPEIIPRQEILYAGPLNGLLKVQDLSEDELTPVIENKTGDPLYVKLGKKVVKKLYSPIKNFINVLRTNYGQYWIPEFKKWDSREESLGSYCKSKLQLEWSLDEKTWSLFVPDKHKRIVDRSAIKWEGSEHLTKEDWQELIKVAQNGYEPSPAAFLLMRAHSLSDQGELRYAFIEGVSALDVALHEFYHKIREEKILSAPINQFLNELSMPAKITTVATTIDKISLQDIEKTLNAINMRNRVVHDGFNPLDLEGANLDKAKDDLSGLLKTIASLLKGPRFKFPSLFTADAVEIPRKEE